MANTSYLTPIGGYSDAGAIMLRNMANDAKLLTEFLRFQGRVFKHPASVALEFFTQKPDATFIATAAQWEKAGFTVTPGSDAIKFFDEHGKTIEMYDFSQCEEEAPPMIWAVTNQNLAAVKEDMGIPADSRLIDGLVMKSVDSELIVNAMRMLNVPPQNHAAFQHSMVSSVAQIIAGRLSVNGGNFRLETDNTAFKSLKSTEQRMIYLAITGKAAREVLRQIERIVTETSVQAMLAEQEANHEVRRVAEPQRGREDESDGRGTAADSEGNAVESPDRSESGEAGRRDGLDDHTGDSERVADTVVRGVQAEESERDPDVVPVQSDERDIRDADRSGALDGAGADRQLRDSMDALHGNESSGTGGSDADEAQLPDDGTVGGQERMGVPGSSGPAVRTDVSAPERDIRGESGVGADETVLHGRNSDAGARAGSDHQTVKENTEEPSTKQAGGFSVPAPTEQLRLFGMEDEPEVKPEPVADEKTQLLRDDLRRGSGFQDGKLRIAEYYDENHPKDSVFADYLCEQYGIGGHSGPDMPDVGYDGKGIHIISADKKGNYHYTWTQAAKEIRSMIERGEYITPADIDDAVDNALYYLEEVERLDDKERGYHTEKLKALHSHPRISDTAKARIDRFFAPNRTAELSSAAKYIMDEHNMPMFVDRMAARDEMDDIAQRILDSGEDAAAVAQDFIDESRYIISDHETFEAAEFAAKKDTDGVTFTAEPDSAHPFSVVYSWEQIGEFLRTAAQLHRDVEREAEEAWERDAAENMEAYDALDHHRDVYLHDTRESEGSGYITNARKQDFYNYRLHFDPDQGYLLLADSDREDDLIIRNFTMVNSRIVLHGVQEMGFEVESVEPAFTYELYQMKSGEEHHYHRFESMESNKYAHLTQDDYDLVYSGDLRAIEGDTVQQKLNALYRKFNEDHPADFFGHSMSVSDVVVVTEGSGKTPYYVQPVGFEVMPDFFANKYDLIDMKFTGNPQGFNEIKVAARTDSFEDTGETNMLIADTQVFYARLSENANIADVQKVIQTAYDNNCYLTADSVTYLSERFGEGFMPELPPVNTVFEIPESDQTVNLAAVENFTLTDSFSEYEGGIDSDGHERKDNFSSHSRSLTFTYLGNGIVESELWSDDTDYPITDAYNLYSLAQRDRLFADMYRFVDRAEQLTVSSKPKPVQQEWSYYIVADMKTWSQNETPRSELERFDTLDAAIARFNELRSEAYNDEVVYAENNPDLPLARLTLGVRHSSGTIEFDLIQVRGGQNMLNADYSRYEQARDSMELQESITAVAEWCGIDSVLDYERNENGNYVPVTTPYEQPQTQDVPERNYVLVLNDNDRAIQFGEVFDTLEDAQDAGNDAIHGGQAIGYAVLNRQEQKVEVYDSDFPTSGVFSEEVYANSSFQTLTVHTDAPLKPAEEPEPQKKGRPTRAQQLYKLFAEMYPEIVSGEHEYERYEDPDGEESGFEPLAVENHGGGQYSWSTFYFQMGDLMADPDFCFLLDHENKRMEILSFQMDGVPPYGTMYECCIDDTGNVDERLRAELEQTFLQNLKNARDVGRQLVRYTDKEGRDITIEPDKEPEPEPEQPESTDPSAQYRAVLNAFSEKHNLGEMNVQQDGRGRATIYERFADGKDMQLFMLYPSNASPEALQSELEGYERTMDYRGDKIENVSRRQAYIQIHGQSELPPVPDVLPEIVYAADPRGKLHDNIVALRELIRLRKCEENNQPLYHKQRSNDHSKEVSDMTLRRYSGWGGPADVFDESKDRFDYDRSQLHRYLTDDEYKAIRASVTDAHYTPQIVVDAMWTAVLSMGLERDSRILEPSCGTGNFISRMPHSIGNGGVVGVEIDSITAEIASRLHNDRDNVKILNCGFEHSGLPDGSFDLAIGNVPFGDYTMNDPDYAQDWLIHDAFFRKALDKVAPGGVVAFITSSGTLDKKTSKVREYLASQAELIGAIRLPNTTFAEAGTGVTADIIFLKKRETPLPVHEAKPDWCYTAETEDGLRINSYFVQNPNMILGTMRKTGYFDRLTCDPKPGTALKEQLQEAIQSLNAKITITRRNAAAKARQEQIEPWGKDYSFHEKDGKIYYRQGEHMDQVRGNTAELNRLRQLIEIRTITRQLLDKQKTNIMDEALTAIREKLNALYDAYVRENGALSSAENKKRFGKDADYPILQSLENYNSKTETYEKADIFFHRTVSPVAEIKAVETLDEAYQVSLDRRGKPDIPYMAALLQNTEPDMEPGQLMEKIQRDLLTAGMVFLDPEKSIPGVPFSAVTDRSEYLSGNVRRKLAFAEEKARNNPLFLSNVEALQGVIPETIHAEEITVRMGCSWIDAEDYTRFLHMLSGRDSWDIRCEVTYIPQTGEFDILKAGSRKDLNVNEGTTYGTDSLTMYEIALKMLNQTRIVVNKTVPSPKDPSKTVTRVDPEKTRLAQEKAKQIEAKFKEWIFADPQRKAKYEKIYNDRFNALVGRHYDGSRLTFNGMANDFELRPHQRDCIARAVYGGNTLAAHVVGAGKSAVFITAVMKKKELGLIHKACIVVPKALTEQTALEWRKIFPDARLLTVGEMDLSTQEKRDVFTARIATGNYDAVIVSREQFDKMAMSPAYQREYIQREIDELEDMLTAQKMAGATKNTPSVKKIEAAKKRLEKRLEKALDPKKQSTRRKDEVLEFEQLGFDYLVVDESHAYKNGFVSTKMTDVAGVTTAPSGRAQDMQMKCDWMNKMLGQGHILHCTGTPVSNSMTELYVVTRYLHPELLKAAGVERFDDWAATFGKVVCAYKQSPSGQLKLKTSFSKFANLPELMAMYKEFADIQSAEKLHLPRPELIGSKPEIVKVDATPEQRAYVRELAARAQLISTGVVDPHLDNLLKITGEARLIGMGNHAVAALYRQREEGELPEGFMEDDPGKIDACVDRVWQYYNETAEQKGVQIIFSDIAVNSDNGNWSVYEYIRDELIAKGIPRDEIIFAPKADSKDREAIFRDINDGKYRVVIGSTGTIGTGANIQQRLYALHHCDIPWKPSDFEQREGRILRQGNSFPAVRIINYVTEGTLDSYLYQVVTDKARFIAQLLDDECPARVSEDCDEKVLTFAELQAAAEGNPDFKTRIELSNRIAELTALKQAHLHEQGKMQKRVEQIPGEITQLRTQIEQMQEDLNSAKSMRDAEGKVKSFDFVTPMRTIRKHEDINAYLHEQIAKRIERPFDEMPKFRIGDFTVSVEIRPCEMNEAMLAVKGKREPSYAINVGSAANADNWQRIVNFLDGAIEKAISDNETKITKLEADLKQAQERVGVPFDGEEELLKARIDFAELEERLSGLSEQQDAIIDPDETDEEETAEERAEREAYQNADDDDYPMIPDENAPRRGPRR